MNCEDIDLQNDMRFFDRCTRQFVHWLQRDSSPDAFVTSSTDFYSLAKRNVFSRRENSIRLSIHISDTQFFDLNFTVVSSGLRKIHFHLVCVFRELANYEWPFLVVVGILFFSAFATFITGFGIIFYKKFRKTGRHDKPNEISVNKSGSGGFMYILAVVCCFLIITDVCLFISNNHISKELPRARRTLISSIDDLQNFQNTTIQALDHILRDDFDREVGGSLNQFRDLADCSSGGLDLILRKRIVHFNKASISALSALYKTRDTISRINVTLVELHGISSNLRSELGKMNLYFKEAKRLCSTSQHIISGDICKKFFSETEDAFARNKPKKVANNVTEVVSRLDTFLKHLNFSSVSQILKSQEDVERHLCKERSGKLREIEKLCNGIQIARSFALDTVKKYSNQLAERSLIPIKNKVGLALGTDGSIGQYDRKRWWFSFLIILVVLLGSLTTLVSLVLKQIEPFIFYLPSNIYYMVELKKLFPLLPKRLLLSSTIVHLSMAVVVNLCAGMAFLLVSNMALACQMSSHYEKLDDIFGTSDLLQESKLLAKERKSFKLFKRISECPEDGTLWAMFNLDEKFDINDSVNQLNGIPRIAARLFQEDYVFDRTKEKQLQQFDKILQEYRKVGLDKININSLIRQIHNPIFDKSFQKLSEALLSSYDKTRNVTRTSFKMSRSLSKQASIIEDNYVKMYSVASKLLNEYLKSFNKSREQAAASFVNMNDIYSDIADDSVTQTKDQVVDHQVMKTVKVIKNFMKDSIRKVRSEVGKCGPVKRAYNQTVCLFCRDLFGSWNYWWMLLLDCGFLLIFAIILCFLTLKRLI